MEKGKFIIVSGPSGVGKGTIFNRVVKEVNGWYSVSFTSRSPREGDIEGKTYFFITREEFEDKIKNGEILEYNYYNGNYYGTSRKLVLDKINAGVDVFLEIDVNGAHNIKNMFPDSVLIYIAPPSMEELKRRLIDRGTEDMNKIEGRLKIAEDEQKEIDFYDYVVINDDLEKATNEVREIIKKVSNQ